MQVLFREAATPDTNHESKGEHKSAAFDPESDENSTIYSYKREIVHLLHQELISCLGKCDLNIISSCSE